MKKKLIIACSLLVFPSFLQSMSQQDQIAHIYQEAKLLKSLALHKKFEKFVNKTNQSEIREYAQRLVYSARSPDGVSEFLNTPHYGALLWFAGIDIHASNHLARLTYPVLLPTLINKSKIITKVLPEVIEDIHLSPLGNFFAYSTASQIFLYAISGSLARAINLPCITSHFLEYPSNKLAFSPDQRYLAVACGCGMVTIISTTKFIEPPFTFFTGTRVITECNYDGLTIPNHDAVPEALQWTHDSKQIAVCMSNSFCQLINAETGKTATIIQQKSNAHQTYLPFSNLEFTTSTTLIAKCHDHIIVFDIDSKKSNTLQQLGTSSSNRFDNRCCYIPSSIDSRIAIAGGKENIYIYDYAATEPSQPTAIINGIATIDALAFNPDATLLAASTATNNNIFVFDVETKEIIAQLEGHSKLVRHLVWIITDLPIPEPKLKALPPQPLPIPLLVSASLDGTLRFWDCQTCKLLLTLTLFSGNPIKKLEYHSATRKLLVNSENAFQILDLAEIINYYGNVRFEEALLTDILATHKFNKTSLVIEPAQRHLGLLFQQLHPAIKMAYSSSIKKI